MYIYELPFEVNRELCRILDNDDNWKELAGIYMRFKAFEINEMEQNARRHASSPTAELFTRWGQLNHRVEELFILLYRMKHIPALHCLKYLVGDKFQRLLSKHGSSNSHKASLDENGNKPNPPSNSSHAFIPRPVVDIELGVQNSSGIVNGLLPTESSRDSNSISSSSHDTSTADVNCDIIKQVSTIPQIEYRELQDATNNWSDASLLGQGGFGQVYKCEWKQTMVAVKRLKNDGKNRELISEMLLNQYRQDNILPLYAYSLGGSEACLVYQLMSGGSLEQRLRCKPPRAPLAWPQRHRVAHGVAKGLQFLHTVNKYTPLIHGDIKPANILLDQCGIPKIGDFGLARQGPYGEERTHLKVSKVHGTRPYLPDEYLRSRLLSTAVDVFSFGVVLLEIATALPALDRNREAPLLSDYMHLTARDQRNLASLEDRILINTAHSNPSLCSAFLSLGISCTAPARKARPDMLQVYKRLDGIKPPGADW